MNVLLIGAGASRATSGLPTALDALGGWQDQIRGRYPLLALALDVWVGDDWPAKDLESAWTQIDLAWKERPAGSRDMIARDLTHAERRRVWAEALRAAQAEPSEPAYYRPQIDGARDLGHSAEQFLSITAGWEFRRLIQETFVVAASDGARALYTRLLEAVRPDAIISFNYDTLVEQCLPAGRWTYAASAADPGRIVVLKPHGSVNWTHRYPRIAGPAEQVDFGVTLPPNAMGYRPNWLHQNAVIGLRTKLEHTPAEGSAVIRTLFRDVLKRSEDVVAGATQIGIVGYRFAEADTGFLDTLARAVARRPRPAETSVIGYQDRDAMIARVREVFALPAPQSIEECFDGLERWAEHGFHAAR